MGPHNIRTINYLHVEISTLCNAACPCCPRYNTNTPVTGEGLHIGYITVETFKEWFPPSVMERVKSLTFCGNHGDPGTNPDLPKIIEYLSNFKLDKFNFNTNGGMKTPKFWKEVAEACNKCDFLITPVFSIDGLEDTNHIYRRNVKWNNLMKNVKGFISKFKTPSTIIWDYLVFKHNEHQIHEAEAFSKKLGIGTIWFKHPLNLDDGENITPIPSLDKDGSVLYWIYPSDYKRFKPTYLSKDAKVVEKKPMLRLPVEERGDWKGEYTEEEKKVFGEFERTKIVPRCKPNDLYVESDGTVHQCCFVANGFYDIRDSYLKGKHIQPPFQNYLQARENLGFDNFNLQHTTIEEMEKLDVLNKLNTYSWNKTVEQGKALICAHFCGKKQGLDELFEYAPKREV